MCLESQWCSMGVSSTKAPARGGGTSSGRRNSWPSLGEILFWYQSPSWSLANPLPLLSWVDQFLKAWPLPLLQRWRRWWLKSRGCIRSIFCLAQEAEDAEKEREWMSNWVHDLMDQRYEIKAEIWRLEQDLNSKKEELAQLEARKKELEASGLKGPIAASSVSGLSQGGASAETRAPTKKKKNKQERHPGLPSQERQEYYKSYLGHL